MKGEPMKRVFVRAPYNYDVDLASEEAGVKCEDDSLTIQSEKDEADLNLIVKRYTTQGVPPPVRDVPPLAGDFLEVTDFQSAMNVVRAAEEAFQALPGEVRRRFNFDPGQFVAFCEDASNIEEARKLGLALPKEKVDVSGSRKDVGGAHGAPGEGIDGDKGSAGGGPKGAQGQS